MISNPNHSFFDGFYQEIWQQVIPEELTAKEVNHLLTHHQLDATKRVLDLMCGHGRHTIALAKNGIAVTAIDNLPAYVRHIEQVQQTESLPIEVIETSLLDWKPEGKFDWALCMGNSLNFFSPDELPIVLKKVSDSLVTGGFFWINSWSLAEIVLLDPMDGKSQSAQLGRFSHTNRFHLKQSPLRLEIESCIEDEFGNREEKLAIDFLYSLEQLTDYLAAVGLKVLKTESIPGKKLFEKGDPRAYILIQKIT